MIINALYYMQNVNQYVQIFNLLTSIVIKSYVTLKKLQEKNLMN